MSSADAKVIEHFVGVLTTFETKEQNLTKQIGELQSELNRYQGLITDLKKELEQISSTSIGFAVQELLNAKDDPYKNMSMRWAILYLLAEHTDTALPTAEIASRILAGGDFTNSSNFTSKVSAILGQMVAKGELERFGPDWRILPLGREIWETIKKGEKFLNRHTHGAFEIE